MRKHFLILMLLALLPFAGWAEDAPTPAAPKAKTNLVYTSAAQDLVTAGVAHEGKTYYYAVVDKDATDLAYTDYATTASKKTNAGSYDVYYVELATAPTSATDVASATKLTVTIARANATVTINGGPISKEYGFKIADFTIDDVHTLIGGSGSGAAWAPTTSSGFCNDDVKTVAYTVNWDVDGNVNAGEHHYSISVNAMDNYNVSVVPSSGTWTITPKNLYIRAQNAELTYGDAFTGTEYVEYEGFIEGEDKSVLSGTLSWTTNYEVGSAITGEAPLTTAYSWIPQGQTSTNYNITYQNGNITVKAKDITTTGVTINDIAAVTYNKTSLQPKAIEGTFTKGQFTRPLTYDTNAAKTDYVLSYYNGSAAVKNNAGKITGLTTSATPINADLVNAGTYVVKIEGKNNFKGTVYKEFKINKKKLGVRAKDVNVVYNGTTNWITNVTTALANSNATDGALNDFFDVIEFDGLVPASGQANVEPATADAYPAILAPSKTFSVKFQQNAVDATEAIKAGDYNIVITSGTDIFTNYEPIYANGSQGGKLKVAKRVVKGKVENQGKKFGTPDAFTEGVAGTEELISITTASANDGLVSGHNITAYPLVKRDAGEEKDEYNLYLSSDEMNKFVVKTSGATPVDVTENYEFDITPGKFTIGEGTISIYANNKTITYGEMTVAQAKQALTAMIIGMTDAEVEQVQADVNAKLTLEIPEELELEDNDFLPANTTGYSIKIGDLTGVIPADILANYNSTFDKFDENAKFIVNKKALTKIETKQQALQYGDKIDALKKNASTIVITGLVEGEDAEAVIADMRFAFADYVDRDGNGAIITPDESDANKYKNGVYFKAIKLDNSAELKNYTYPNLTDAKKFVAGNLVVTPATAAMKLDGFTSETVAADQANNITKLTENNGKKVNIQFANRSLKKEQWGVLVLPFETTVREISNALGYAVVDLINPAKGDENNVYFKLHMGTIPANTPFMVKTDANIDLSTISYNSAAATNVDLVKGKTIVKDVDEEGKTTGVEGAAGTKFYGLYKPVTLSHNYQWFINSGEWSKKAEGKTTKVLALRAYLQLAANADVQNARVFIEEPDGTTTVIKAVNVDGLEVGNDGWFTLNGMKLNSVPTEKGIYIHNGKKVILK